MESSSSRRRFLTAGLALPAAGLAAGRRQFPAVQPPLQLAADKALELRYRVLGSTGLKVTAVGMGCMITSDPIVIERAADIGINYFDTARSYQGGNNEKADIQYKKTPYAAEDIGRDRFASEFDRRDGMGMYNAEYFLITVPDEQHDAQCLHAATC